jgi:hypothetical protein
MTSGLCSTLFISTVRCWLGNYRLAFLGNTENQQHISVTDAYIFLTVQQATFLFGISPQQDQRVPKRVKVFFKHLLAKFIPWEENAYGDVSSLLL